MTYKEISVCINTFYTEIVGTRHEVAKYLSTYLPYSEATLYQQFNILINIKFVKKIGKDKYILNHPIYFKKIETVEVLLKAKFRSHYKPKK